MSQNAESPCGNCTACCFVFAVKDTTKMDEWCSHCKIGEGCGRHTSLPTHCDEYECQFYSEVKATRSGVDKGVHLFGANPENRPDRLGVIANKVTIKKTGTLIRKLIEISPGMADTQRVQKIVSDSIHRENITVLVIKMPRDRGGVLHFPDAMRAAEREEIIKALTRVDSQPVSE